MEDTEDVWSPFLCDVYASNPRLPEPVDASSSMESMRLERSLLKATIDNVEAYIQRYHCGESDGHDLSSVDDSDSASEDSDDDVYSSADEFGRNAEESSCDEFSDDDDDDSDDDDSDSSSDDDEDDSDDSDGDVQDDDDSDDDEVKPH